MFKFDAIVNRGSSDGNNTVFPGIRHITSLNDFNFSSYSSLELYDISKLFWRTKNNFVHPPNWKYLDTHFNDLPTMCVSYKQ